MNLDFENEENEDSEIENNNYNDDNLINLFKNLENQNFDFSINDYVSKIRKKLSLRERTNKNEMRNKK